MDPQALAQMMPMLQQAQGPILYMLAGAGLSEVASSIDKLMRSMTPKEPPHQAQVPPPPLGRPPAAPLVPGGAQPNPLALLAQRGG